MGHSLFGWTQIPTRLRRMHLSRVLTAMLTSMSSIAPFEADALLGAGNQIAEQVSPDSIFNLCVKEFARKNYLTGHC
jgi:hypothetical protein